MKPQRSTGGLFNILPPNLYILYITWSLYTTTEPTGVWHFGAYCTSCFYWGSRKLIVLGYGKTWYPAKHNLETQKITLSRRFASPHMQYELRYRFTGATLCRQGGKVDNVASAITVSRAYFSCNKRTRHETSIDFFFHVALASGRMQILDGASFRTSRAGPLWISVAVFAHTRCAVE